MVKPTLFPQEMIMPRTIFAAFLIAAVSLGQTAPATGPANAPKTPRNACA